MTEGDVTTADEMAVTTPAKGARGPHRKVDIAFPRIKLAVQVDGCFRHRCPEHGSVPERNSEWWRWKMARNRTRNRDTDERLAALGWTVLHVWEHEEASVAAERAMQVIRR